MEHNYDKELLDFIQSNPSPYHVIEAQKKRLLEAGYEQLLESASWTIRAGGKYFVTRNGSAIIAFRVPEKTFKGFMIMASHSDSPMLKIKENPEITVEGAYQKLNVEVYGGALVRPAPVGGGQGPGEDGARGVYPSGKRGPGPAAHSQSCHPHGPERKQRP